MTAPDATSSGESVIDAISNGEAASAIPSPRLLVHDDASSQRKSRPSRRGATHSPMPTARAYGVHATPEGFARVP